MEHLAGQGMVNQLNRPNLDDAVTVQRVKAGRLGIDDDFSIGYPSDPSRTCIQIGNVKRWIKKGRQV
jgi:hypothetical protein